MRSVGKRRPREYPRHAKRTDGQRWLAAQASGPAPSLGLWDVARSALRAGRHHFGRVVATTLVVYLILVGVETLLSAVTTPSDTWSTVTGQFATSAFDLVGATFIAGFFCRSVGAAEHGLPEETTWEVLRDQPYSRLIRADLLVTASVVVGTFVLLVPAAAALSALGTEGSPILFVLIVPGFVILNLLGLVGSAIKLERRTVIDAARRSAQVVRRHFWTVFALITVPLLVGSEVATRLQDLVHHAPAASFVVRILTEGAVAALCGLIQSELGYRLLATAYIREASGEER
jgi:hypothetical protein